MFVPPNQSILLNTGTPQLARLGIDFLHRMWSIAMPSTLRDLPYRMAALQFQRAVGEMEVWSANSDDYSFAISFFKSFSGPGFHGRSGYVASWRPLYGGRRAIGITGSPFKSLEEAEVACDAMLEHLVGD